MRLSEAMLQGAAKRPQAKGLFFALIENDLCSCALGAAMEGCGLIKADQGRGQLQGNLQDKIMHEYKVLGHSYKHPVKNEPDALVTIIVNLNDMQGWTREQIADWLKEQGL